MEFIEMLQNFDLQNPYFHGAAAAVAIVSLILYWFNKKPGEAFRFRYIVSGIIATLAAFAQEAASTTYTPGSPYWTAFGAGFMAAGFWWLMTRLAAAPVEDQMDRKNIPQKIEEIAPEVAAGMSDLGMREIAEEIKKATDPDDIAELLKKLKGIL